MRYATFSLANDPTQRLGAVVAGRMVDVAGALAGTGSAPGSVIALVQAGPAAWKRTADVLKGPAGKNAAAYGLDEIRWHAPVPRPTKNIVCLGQNYLAHLKEAAAARGREAKIPAVPVFFTKAPTSVNGPYDPVPWDRSATGQVDYEAELGVVIGVGGKNIPRDSAFEHVFGYTIINDVSARDQQAKHFQWFKGKSLDGFCPMGPVIVTADEFGDPHAKKIALRLNGGTMQSASTGDMIFRVDVIIESLSQGMTIEPGDIIATGTPEGVGFGKTPQVYMNDGDVMETEVEGIRDAEEPPDGSLRIDDGREWTMANGSSSIPSSIVHRPLEEPMRSRVVRTLAAVGLALALCQAAASDQQTKKEYQFRGKVEKVDAKGGMMTVAGEKVDGWMGAMTMVYSVDKPDVLKELKAGDSITAKVYEGDFKTLHDVQKAPAAAGRSPAK